MTRRLTPRAQVKRQHRHDRPLRVALSELAKADRRALTLFEKAMYPGRPICWRTNRKNWQDGFVVETCGHSIDTARVVVDKRDGKRLIVALWRILEGIG